MVSDLCGEESLYLGELDSDDVWRFNDTDDLDQIQVQSGSCVWDFADHTDYLGERHLFAGAHPNYPDGPIYKSDFPQYPGGTCTLNFGPPPHNLTHEYGTGLYNWALQSFNGLLYVGGGNQPSNQPSPNGGAKLMAFDGVNWPTALPVVRTWPTTLTGEGVSAIAVFMGEMFVGLGVPDGYSMNSWEGCAEVWSASNGVDFVIASPSDALGNGIFGGGVQCLLATEGTSKDCNGNSIPDECETQTDVDLDGVIDICDNCPEVSNVDQTDTDQDGIGDACDICPEYPFVPDPTDCNGIDGPDECELDKYPERDQCPGGGDGTPDECQNLTLVCGLWCVDISEHPFWADSDTDCDVDSDDFAFWQQCEIHTVVYPNRDLEWFMTQPWYDPACALLDRNCDHLIDQQDLNEFLAVDGGPGVRVNHPACPEPAPPPPPDEDDDGVPDDGDNCPTVANGDQADGDEDGVGTACDNCPTTVNADQADMDGDDIGDVCDDDRDGDGIVNGEDNCPDYYDPYEWDQDGDGIGDMCDPDLDGDGILNDGDADGQPFFWTCVGGNTVDCDDNCAFDVNPYQEDWDSDGIGNACDPDPGEEPEEEGMMAAAFAALSEDLASTALSEDTAVAVDTEAVMADLAVPASGAFAYFVTHDGTATSASLPASGGTVVVDLIVATADPLEAWEGLPTTTAANVVSINATGWTAEAELLAWARELGYLAPAASTSTASAEASLPSRYNCGVLWWFITTPRGGTVCQAWVKDAICLDRLFDDGAKAYTGSYDLDAIAGPIATPASESLTTAAAISATADVSFTTASPIGGLMSRTLQPGAARVATLTLQVAGTPGTYNVSFTGGSYYSQPAGTSQPMQPGPTFEIRVGR